MMTEQLHMHGADGLLGCIGNDWNFDEEDADMTPTIRVYLSSAREIGPRDINGASSFVVGERETLVYEGAPIDAAEALRAIPVGMSVCVRHAGGLRSCMNKPALWEWTAALAA